MHWFTLIGFVAACAPASTRPPSCKERFQPGELVITEVLASPAINGAAWFEIYNPAVRARELAGLTITHSHSDGSSARSHVVTGATIAPGGYLTLGDAPPDALPSYVDYGYGSDLGGLDKAGKLALSCDTGEIDATSYQHATRGHARELTSARPPDAALNDDPASWCQATETEFDAGSFGTPGAASDCVPLAMGTCSDGDTVRDIAVASSGDLVITEVMASPSAVSDTVGEWFEAKAIADVDLNGLALDRVGDAARPSVIAAPACLHVAAGGLVVFARSADPATNGGLPAVAATFTMSLVTGVPARPGDVRIVAGQTVIDAVAWTHSKPGKALQLDPARTDAISNDAESSFCDATAPYGVGDLGTPGAANSTCPLVPAPGMCDDAGTLRAIVKPSAGQLRITEIMAHPRVQPIEEWFEIANTGNASFDLNELGLDRAGDTRTPDIIHATECRSVAPGAFALFARSSDPAANGMLPPTDGTFGFTLVDSGGDVRVLDGALVLDAVTWATSTDGVSLQLVPERCPAVAQYGDLTNHGTPRAPNVCT